MYSTQDLNFTTADIVSVINEYIMLPENERVQNIFVHLLNRQLKDIILGDKELGCEIFKIYSKHRSRMIQIIIEDNRRDVDAAEYYNHTAKDDKSVVVTQGKLEHLNMEYLLDSFENLQYKYPNVEVELYILERKMTNFDKGEPVFRVYKCDETDDYTVLI